MIIALFIIAVVIEIGLPFVIARWTTRRYNVKWSLFWIGMLTFFGSQVLHIPFLNWLTGLFHTGALTPPPQQYAGIFNAVLLGLLAGIFEETARLVAYLVLKKRADSWGAALTLGAGHGGLEAVIIGLTTLVNLVLIAIVSQYGPNALPFLDTLGPVIHAQVSQLANQAWYVPLLGAFERITAISAHILLSVIVWLSVSKRNALWFVLAVLYHAFIDAVAVFTSSLGWPAVQIEAVLGLFMLVNLACLYIIRQWVKDRENPPQVEGAAE